MNDYKNALNEYRITLRTTAGCGARAQGYIDSAHAKIVAAVAALTEEEIGTAGFSSAAAMVPPLQECQNDGTDGLASGISAMVAQNGNDCAIC